MGSRLGPVFFALAFASNAACIAVGRPPPPRVVELPPVMHVFNQGQATIQAVLLKPCGSDDATYYELASTMAPPGGGFDIPMQSGCVDLQAVDPNGNVVGRQYGLEMMPGATWTIR